jgi:LCP family protein required for cell wall assembly
MRSDPPARPSALRPHSVQSGPPRPSARRPASLQPDLPVMRTVRAAKRKPPRRRGHPLRSLLLVLFGFLLSGMGGAGAYFMPAMAAAVQQTGQQVHVPAPGGGAPAAAATSDTAAGIAPFTVLLLGSDDDQKIQFRSKDHLLTQSMILVRVNPATRQVTMLSIPRDLWVPLSGGEGKIMSAYSRDGATSAIATVERDFNVHIDDYVWIGLEGLIRLIDLVGGVDVITTNPVMDDYYPNDINSKNPYGYQRIAVLPGPQHLDGIHALQYVRSRHSDLRGDLGRNARQQQVLLALRAKAKYLNPADLPDVAASFNGELRTNMQLDQVARLLPLAAKLQLQNIHQVVLYGNQYTSQSVIGGQDVLIPHWGAILPLVHQYFPPAQ